MPVWCHSSAHSWALTLSQPLAFITLLMCAGLMPRSSATLFWLLAATDGHAKNFSLHLGPRGSFRMTPLYDVMSVYPVLGRGRNQIDAHHAGLAMAVVSKNRHYALHDIQPRHWLEMGRRCGVDARAIAGELCAQAPAAIAAVSAMLPSDFPTAVSEPIFAGLAKAASGLIAGLPP